jgi:hypothetical protein
MIVRALDNNGDWTYGNSFFKRKDDAVMQSIKTKLQSWKGDCFFDLQAGVDWTNIIGSKSANNKALAIADIKRVIAQIDAIITIDLDFDILKDRSLTVSYTVTTIYKTIISREVLIA